MLLGLTFEQALYGFRVIPPGFSHAHDNLLLILSYIPIPFG